MRILIRNSVIFMALTATRHIPSLAVVYGISFLVANISGAINPGVPSICSGELLCEFDVTIVEVPIAVVNLTKICEDFILIIPKSPSLTTWITLFSSDKNAFDACYYNCKHHIMLQETFYCIYLYVSMDDWWIARM